MSLVISMELAIPEEIWLSNILLHVNNNVHTLQCLRAVNRGFREAVDTRVMKLITTIRTHPSHSTPPDVEVDVTEDQVATTEQAGLTGADWVLLGCVAEKRWRQQFNTEKYTIFRASTCDMQGKSFMHYWTATICGKYAGGGAYPTGFKKMASKMLMRDSVKCPTKLQARHAQVTGQTHKSRLTHEKYARVRDAWIEVMMKKLKHGIPAHCDKEHTMAKQKMLLEHAMYSCIFSKT